MVLRVAGGTGTGGGNALTSNPLSQFASTTSAQLRGVISDETGTGTAVFNTSPALAGVPTAPTAAQANNSTQLATTAYVDTGLAAKANVGLVGLNPTDVTASRALTAADFNGTVLRVNSASVVAITVPTVASMSLAATTGQLRVLAFECFGAGIPTFAGATSSTTINGTAGTTTALPLGGAPVQYGFYVLTQLAVGGDAWSLM